MSKGSNDERMPLDRRAFLKSGALGAGAVVSLAGCGGRDEKLIPLLISEENILPGVDRWTVSTCGLCAAGCGISARSMLGEARVQHNGEERRQMVLQVKKIEGNAAHPVNRGRLCARGQAGPQVLYNPDRIRTPLRASGPRGSGRYEPIAWDQALALLDAKVQPILSLGPGTALAAVAGPGSPLRRELLRRVLSAVGSDRLVVAEPLPLSAVREANRRLFGRPQLESHDVENARYILSFGADLLAAHTSPVRYNFGLAESRQGHPGRRGKFVHVEGRFSLSAANADEWLPARPGTEGIVALALAHTILKEELFPPESARAIVGFEAYRRFVLDRFVPEKVSEQVDIPAKKLVRVAREFARNQPGFALAGGAAVAHPHGVWTAAAVASLNALVGSVGRAGGVAWPARPAEPAPPPEGRFWAEALAAAAATKVLLVWDADPLFHAPAAVDLPKALGRVEFIAAFSPFLNDTTAFADLILPDLTYLERWDLIEPEVTAGARALSIEQPIVRPLYEARDRAEVLIGLAKKWGGKPAAAVPDADYPGFLKAELGRLGVLGRGSPVEAEAGAFWDQLVKTGVWVDTAAPAAAPAVNLSVVSDGAPPTAAREDDFLLLLQPFETTAFGDGATANLPWLQELPDPMTSIVWGAWVELNANTAAELGIADSEIVRIESAAGKIELPAVLSPAARPDVVAIPVGQGHRLFGRYASGRGASPWEIVVPRFDRMTGDLAWGATRVKVVGTGRKGRVLRLGVDRQHTAAELHR